MRRRRVVAPVLAAGLVVTGALAFAGYNGAGPLASKLEVSVSEVTPVAFAEPRPGGDPLVISVLIPWSEDGYCSGQFTVSAIQTDQEVRVSPVTSRVLRGVAGCAGLGTVKGMATAELTLEYPLGQRRVIRASDGTPLPRDTR